MNNQETPIFHIHVDAIQIDSEFERYLCDTIGFYRVEYSIDRKSVDLDDSSPEHEFHLTYKTSSSVEFNKVYKTVEDICKQDNVIKLGYIEGEYIAFSEKFGGMPFMNNTIPFRLHMKPPKPSHFRESEIHVTLSRDESDKRLLTSLENDINLLSGFIPKSWGMAQIFTVQGTREQIDQIRQPLWDFLQASGGAVRGSIKEERTTRYWMSHPSGIGLPFVVDKIEFLE